MNQRKYALEILEKTGILDCKLIDTPMDLIVKLLLGQGEPLLDLGRLMTCGKTKLSHHCWTRHFLSGECC